MLLREKYPTMTRDNLKELAKNETFGQLMKGLVLEPASKVDLSFPEDVRTFFLERAR